jgi:hypothetical protein
MTYSDESAMNLAQMRENAAKSSEKCIADFGYEASIMPIHPSA